MEHKLHNRILSALLALILVLTGFPVAAFAEGENTDVPESTLCEVCGEDPCACQVENEECEECGQELCVCDLSSSCEVCGENPCICQVDNEGCEECGQEPCVCDPSLSCEMCGEDPCICVAEDENCENCGTNPCICEEAGECVNELCGCVTCACVECGCTGTIWDSVGEAEEIQLFGFLDKTNEDIVFFNDNGDEYAVAAADCPDYLILTVCYPDGDGNALVYEVDSFDDDFWNNTISTYYYVEASYLLAAVPAGEVYATVGAGQSVFLYQDLSVATDAKYIDSSELDGEYTLQDFYYENSLSGWFVQLTPDENWPVAEDYVWVSATVLSGIFYNVEEEPEQDERVEAAYETLLSADSLEEYEAILDSLDTDVLAKLQESDYWQAVVEEGHLHVYSHFYSVGTVEEYYALVEAYPDAWEYIQNNEELKYYNDLHLERIYYVAEHPATSITLGEVVYVDLPSYTDVAPRWSSGSGTSTEAETPSATSFALRSTLPALTSYGLYTSAALATAEASSTDATDEDNNGVGMSKTVTYNEETGEYTIRLEVYSAGGTVTVVSEQELPADIILVLDLSRSMESSMDNVGYQALTGGMAEDVYLTYGDALYVEIDGTYQEVTINGEGGSSATKYVVYKEEYTSSGGNGPGGGQNQSKSNYRASELYDYINGGNALYYLVDGEYYQVTATKNENNRYSFSCSNGTNSVTILDNVARDTTVNSSTYKFYTQETVTVYASYTYSYVDAGGTTITNTYAPSDSVVGGDNPTYYITYADGTITRAEALKNAVTTFANQVAEKAKGTDGELGTDDDVAHNIAIVGYSGKEQSNTGVYIGSTIDKYSDGITTYATALQDMSTADGAANITASIEALGNNTGTYTYAGMVMANGILAAQDSSRYVDDSGNTIRSKVVVVFTDGEPKDSSNSSSDDAYNLPIEEAYKAKNTYGATVYTVGILDDGDVSIPPTTDLNKFMHYMSSNYKDATSLTSSGELTNTDWETNGGYYLLASNANDLNNIFSTISSSATSGGSITSMGTTTEVRDIISPYFTLPDGADASDIRFYSDAYIGENTWEDKPTEETGVTATVGDDGKTIGVSGFDFSENWVGVETDENGAVTGYHGKKLIIEFPVVVEPDFLGGSGVVTNGSNSGVYESVGSDGCIEKFELPVVDDIPLKTLETVVEDKSIYYGNTLDLTNILALYVTESTSGELLQVIADGNNNAYVELVYEVTLNDQTVVTYSIPAGEKWEDGTWTNEENETVDMSALSILEDTTYSVRCTMTSTDNDETKEIAEGTAKIYVFKPTITFRDAVKTPYTSYVNYARDNYVDVVWKHEGNEESYPAFDGNDDLILTYTPEAGCVNSSDLVISEEDFYVAVTVKKLDTKGTEDTADDVETDIQSEVSFAHSCVAVKDCGFSPVSGQFMIHVSTGNIQITKTITVLEGGKPPRPTNFTFVISSTADGFDELEQYAVFVDGVLNYETVTDGSLKVTLSNMAYDSTHIILVVGLPVGTYTVEEEETFGFATNFDSDSDYENQVDVTVSRNETVKVKCDNIFPVYIGNLKLSKTVKGEDPEGNREFEFTITLTPQSEILSLFTEFNYTYQISEEKLQSGTVSFGDATSAEIAISLKAGETVTFFGLPVGSYSIKETEDSTYTTTYTGDSGEITTTSTSKASFINWFELVYCELTIVQENVEDTECGIYEVLDSAGNLILTVMIKGENSVTVEQIPEDEYTVREYGSDGQTADWTWAYEIASGKPTPVAVEKDGDNTVTFSYESKHIDWLHHENGDALPVSVTTSSANDEDENGEEET